MIIMPPAGEESRPQAVTPSPRHPVTPSPRPLITAATRRWVWFFAVLAGLLVPFVAIQLWFNWRQQLTLERLAEARRRWDEKGPRDYVLKYAVKREHNPD